MMARKGFNIIPQIQIVRKLQNTLFNFFPQLFYKMRKNMLWNINTFRFILERLLFWMFTIASQICIINTQISILFIKLNDAKYYQFSTKICFCCFVSLNVFKYCIFIYSSNFRCQVVVSFSNVDHFIEMKLDCEHEFCVFLNHKKSFWKKTLKIRLCFENLPNQLCNFWIILCLYCFLYAIL